MIPMLGITGYSGSGKTTLLEKVVPTLMAQGVRVSVIKHSHHNAQVDKVGKDSWRMKDAGAAQVILACDQRWALMTETPAQTLDLAYLAQQFDPNLTDLILVEGFKHEPIEKILLHRQAMSKPLDIQDEAIIALATDYPLNSTHHHLDINNTAEIASFILRWYQQKCGTK
ncbi:molybdopterin-guanine dinucleotide biosynthesis protein MobB [Pasteurella sp. PK-2025]|uniref:molybdopterin-guanine dinucleotide biosynthesis protein MobB n=1 Tax=Pasteurella sp. PK-2025 TaxID=3413133 RepID=UPI003C71BB43